MQNPTIAMGFLKIKSKQCPLRGQWGFPKASGIPRQRRPMLSAMRIAGLRRRNLQAAFGIPLAPSASNVLIDMNDDPSILQNPCHNYFIASEITVGLSTAYFNTSAMMAV